MMKMTTKDDGHNVEQSYNILLSRLKSEPIHPLSVLHQQHPAVADNLERRGSILDANIETNFDVCQPIVEESLPAENAVAYFVHGTDLAPIQHL